MEVFFDPASAQRSDAVTSIAASASAQLIYKFVCRRLFIQNKSTGTLWIEINATSTSNEAASAFAIAPGEIYTDTSLAFKNIAIYNAGTATAYLSGSGKNVTVIANDRIVQL